jgi:hypothetical protein
MKRQRAIQREAPANALAFIYFHSCREVRD